MEPLRWVFGEEPLAEVVALAAAVRDLTSTVLALEQAPAEISALTAELMAANRRLTELLPADLTPRVGHAPRDEQRVYIDHSRDVGVYNPCFPRYELECADDRGEGTVTFPLLYEGPPGIVHGGFLAVFFDSVLQQLNCDLGVAGKTRSLALKYRRPTPLLEPLRFVATRTVDGDRIHSSGELFRGDVLLCTAEMSAIAGRRDELPDVSPRRRP